MSSNIEEYAENYIEKKLLGRGNYGSAYLVQCKKDKQHYVAKKMMLDGLNEKQVEAAWGEIQILKKVSQLKSPFIVQYKQCFHHSTTLIIIMQYCQHGDLTGFIKNWKKRQQILPQKVVANWLIQIIFGLKMLHSKHVLHRDLKSANIFLTTNKTIKIGDFGISKVLDTTSAKTFVGTPYYLSPQVCESRPYNFKSDIWSVGCILYELCTFSYPFQASNLLGLAMKIVNDKVKPISNEYSLQLNDIVTKLLTKNQHHRISIEEILNLNYVKKYLTTFKQDAIQIKEIKFQIKSVSQASTQPTMKKNVIKHQQAQDTMKTINSQFQGTNIKGDTLTYSNSSGFQSQMIETNTAGMTTAQRLRQKKMRQADQKAQQLNQAIRQNSYQRNFAKDKKKQNLGSSGTFKQTARQYEKKAQQQNKYNSQIKKTANRLLLMNQPIDLQQLSQSLQQMKTIKGVQKQKIQQIPLPSQKQYIIFKQQQPICEELDEQQQLQQYYDEPFEPYVTIKKPTVTAQQQKVQLEDVTAVYAVMLGEQVSPSKKARIENTYKNEQFFKIKSDNQKIATLKNKCINSIGINKFNNYYNTIKQGKFDFTNLKTKYTQQERNAIINLEQIIFIEENN